MLSTSGNSLNNNSANNSNVNNNNSSTTQTTNKSNISNIINSDFMLPTMNNLTLNNNPMASTPYLTDYNKLYRDVSLYQQNHPKNQQQQPSNLIGNNALSNLGNHQQANNLINTTHNLNGIPPNHNLNNLQQQQSTGNNSTSKQQSISNSEFALHMNRCTGYLEASLFQMALEEINQAINLVSNSALARFRKAQALLGLKRFFDCEKELWTCINLEPSNLEYRKELLKVKQIALLSLNLNIDQQTIMLAAQKYDSIKEAVDAVMWTQNNSGLTMDFQNNYPNTSGLTNNQQQNVNNLNENSLLNGWNLHQNRLTSNFNTIGNQLINNTNLLFNNNNLINNNLLLNNQTNQLINRSNNGTNLTSNTSTNSSVGNSNNTNQSTQNTNNNTNLTTLNNQQQTNQQATSNSPLTNDNSTLTNGLNNLTNGNNRFNYLLRNLDQTTASHLLSNQQQSTNGQTNSNQNNQNLINNQQLYNRIINPSFIDNNQTNDQNTGLTSTNKQQHNVTSSNVISSVTSTSSGLNKSILTRNLQSKLNLNDNSIINGSNSLLLMNNLTNSAPSPICAKLNQQQQQQTSNNNITNLPTSTNNLTSSYNIFNQMPEMKLVESLLPGLANHYGNSTSLNNSLDNNNQNDILTPTTNHKLLTSIGKEVNNNIGNKDTLMSNNLINVDNFVNSSSINNEQKHEDDFNKSANKTRSTIGKLDLIDDLNELNLDNKIQNKDLSSKRVIDLKTSNNSLTKEDLLNSNDDQTSITNDQQQNNNQSTNQTISSNNNQTNGNVTTQSTHPTSYSEIVKRAKKITQTSSSNSSDNQELICSSKQQANSNSSSNQNSNQNLTNKHNDINETQQDDSVASKRPTNLWAYNGLRVANVSLTASKTALTNLFSKFGRIRLLERIINKTTTNNIWVYYDNPVSPVDAVTKLQNVYIEGICVDSESPLRLFFAPTDDQKDLKFSRPKQPPDNKECYYYRTTNCFSKDQCPLLHIQANKNIDAQIWMRLNPVNKDAEDNEQTGESASESANES